MRQHIIDSTFTSMGMSSCLLIHILTYRTKQPAYYEQLTNYCSTCHPSVDTKFLLQLADKMHPKKCTVFPFHPWDSKEHRRSGIVLWVPPTIEELINTASEKLEFLGGVCILSEDAGKILDIDLINDGQKLYLVTETHLK